MDCTLKVDGKSKKYWVPEVIVFKQSDNDISLSARDIVPISSSESDVQFSFVVEQDEVVLLILFPVGRREPIYLFYGAAESAEGTFRGANWSVRVGGLVLRGILDPDDIFNYLSWVKECFSQDVWEDYLSSLRDLIKWVFPSYWNAVETIAEHLLKGDENDS